MHIQKTTSFFYISVIVAAIILMLPAFINGYPIVNSDTATYLYSGFKPETPFDRPITYGLFVRLTSLNGWSLWSVILIQGYIISFLLHKLIATIFDKRSAIKYGFLTVLLLSLCSSLSWIVSELQPDLFTAVALLSLVIILLDNSRKNIGLYVLYFVAISMHLSHILLYTLILSFIFLLRKRFFQAQIRAINFRLLALLLLTIGSITIMGPAMAKSRHAFFMAAMLDQGILKKYLDDNCPTHPDQLCAYKDSLPKSSDDFLWDENSPLHKIGWKASKPEFDEIIGNTLVRPRYIMMHISASLKAAFRQLYTIGIGDGNNSFPKGSNVDLCIRQYLPQQEHQFLTAKQNKHDLRNALHTWSYFFSLIVVLSIIFTLFAFFRSNDISGLKFFTSITFVCIVLNAWDCATFATVNARYGCKITWLLVFLSTLYVIKSIKAAYK